MGYLVFFGCLFIAFGPVLATYSLVLTKSPQLVIISIGSAFFWLTSLLVASIWWYIIPPLRDVYFWVIPWTIFFQEAMRFIFFKLYTKGEKGLVPGTQTSQLTAHPDQLKVALAFGVGSGIAHAFITYVSVLWEAMGPGAYFSDSCPTVSIFPLSAVYSLYFTLLHIFWSVIGFEAFRKSNWKLLGAVAVSHLIASFLSYLNAASCWSALILLFFFVVANGVACLYMVLKNSDLGGKVANVTTTTAKQQ